MTDFRASSIWPVVQGSISESFARERLRQATRSRSIQRNDPPYKSPALYRMTSPKRCCTKQSTTHECPTVGDRQLHGRYGAGEPQLRRELLDRLVGRANVCNFCSSTDVGDRILVLSLLPGP